MKSRKLRAVVTLFFFVFIVLDILQTENCSEDQPFNPGITVPSASGDGPPNLPIIRSDKTTPSTSATRPSARQKEPPNGEDSDGM